MLQLDVTLPLTVAGVNNELNVNIGTSPSLTLSVSLLLPQFDL